MGIYKLRIEEYEEVIAGYKGDTERVQYFRRVWGMLERG